MKILQIVVALCVQSCCLLRGMQEEKPAPARPSFAEWVVVKMETNLLKNIENIRHNTELSELNRHNQMSTNYLELAKLYEKDSMEYHGYLASYKRCKAKADEEAEKFIIHKREALGKALIKVENMDNNTERLKRKIKIFKAIRDTYEEDDEEYNLYHNKMQRHIKISELESQLQKNTKERDWNSAINILQALKDLHNAAPATYAEYEKQIRVIEKRLKMQEEVKTLANDYATHKPQLDNKTRFVMLSQLAQKVVELRDTFSKNESEYQENHTQFIKLKHQQAVFAPDIKAKQTTIREAYA